MAVSSDAAGTPRRRRRFSVLTRQDKVVLGLAVGIPAFIHIFLVWLPTIASVVLSFTQWNGIGGIDKIKFVGVDNYVNLFTRYPPFWPALQHNLVWLGVFLFIATPIGIFFAVLLDKNIRGTRLYQSAIYLPVVLSLAIVGFIWQLQYAPEEGFINNVLRGVGNAVGADTSGPVISWLGDKDINLAAVLVAASWRHIGYIMVLYLAGLKSVDPSLREAAAIDGASERQTFFRVVLPVLRPINLVILVITIIESLRAFDIVYVINKGLNGLELLSVLVTQNIVGESSRVGFGSAIAVVLLVISVGPIILFVRRTFEQPS
jgi:multiple sugar transport system permease protein